MPDVEDVLIYGDTVRSAEMRHELPLLIPDPFLYLEKNGERHVVVSALEHPRIAALNSRLDIRTGEEFGFDELLAGGTDLLEAQLEVAVRACRALDLQDCAVPSEFPLELADRLRAAGVSVTADRERFAPPSLQASVERRPRRKPA
jgi:Xaa-Pro aminopeptidase